MYQLNEGGNRHQYMGQKSYNLYLIAKNSIAKIPNSWVIDSEEFRRILAYNQIDPSLHMENEDFFVQVQRVKESIDLLECDETLLNQLQRLQDQFPNQNIAVRSSFMFEDTEQSSNAGMFYSSVNNHEVEQIWNAILQTWKSAFSPLVRDNCNVDGIGVLLQPYIVGIISGVAFSQNQKKQDQLLICYQEGNLETMTAGTSTGKEFVWNKSSIDEIDNTQIRSIAECVVRLEKFFGYPVDIEWLINEQGDLCVLQCRPISQMQNRTQSGPFQIMSVDQWQEHNDFPMEGVNRIHIHWCAKKHWVRKYAIEHGFQVSEVYYIHIPEEGLNEVQCNEVLQHFSTQWIEICSDDIPRTMLLKKDLQKTIEKLRDITVRFESVILTYNAGIASYDKKEDCVITDMVPGSINGIREGNIDPSHAMITTDHIELSLKEHNDAKRFDTQKGCWRIIEELLPLKITLEEKDIREIERMARYFYNSFGQIRIEWIHDGHQVYFFDISFEDEKKTQMISKDAKWLSYGMAYAPVLKLEDTTPLQEIWEGHVSVWRPKEFYDIAKKLDVSKLDTKYKYKDMKPIIVTEAPITHLALLVNHAAGFIFEKGSVLSHFAIILRESGVPAILQEHCMENLNTNDWVKIEE